MLGVSPLNNLCLNVWCVYLSLPSLIMQSIPLPRFRGERLDTAKSRGLLEPPAQFLSLLDVTVVRVTVAVTSLGHFPHSGCNSSRAENTLK